MCLLLQVMSFLPKLPQQSQLLQTGNIFVPLSKIIPLERFELYLTRVEVGWNVHSDMYVWMLFAVPWKNWGIPVCIPQQPQLLQTCNIYVIAQRFFFPALYPQWGSSLTTSGDVKPSLPKVERVFNPQTLHRLAAQTGCFCIHILNGIFSFLSSIWYDFIVYWWLSYAYKNYHQCA